MYDHHMAVDILEGLEKAPFVAPRIAETPTAPATDPSDPDRLLKGTSPGL